MQTLQSTNEAGVENASPASALEQAGSQKLDVTLSQYLFDCDPSLRRVLLNLMGSSSYQNDSNGEQPPNVGFQSVECLIPTLHRLIASVPDSPCMIVCGLCTYDRQDMILAVAESPETLPSVLEILSYHPSAEVRMAVAENPSTPLSTLWNLAKDANPDVRYRQAETYNTPVPILHILIDDENPYVACRAERTLWRLSGLRNDSSSSEAA